MTQNYTLITKYLMATKRRPWTFDPNLNIILLFRSVLKSETLWTKLHNFPSCSFLLGTFTHRLKLLNCCPLCSPTYRMEIANFVKIILQFAVRFKPNREGKIKH